MRFLINIYNHNETGRRSLEDVIAVVAHQLMSLGHKVEWCNDYFIGAVDGINIIVEGFEKGSIEPIAEGHAKGARFIIVATEEPTPSGFNHGVVPGMVARQQIFPEAAQYADAILALVPGAETWYRQFAPSEHIELGYARTLERPVNAHLIDHDFGFFGSKTARRDKMLNRLAKKMNSKNAVNVINSFAEQKFRDVEMQRSRVLVQIRAHEKMGLVSSSRCNTALHIGRPVVAEPHELCSPWDQIIHFSQSTEAFYDDAVRCRAFWQSYHAKQMERFRDIMTPSACIGDQLDKVGIVPLRKAA